MSNQIFTATGCARCKITKRFMRQEDIAYEEFDIKGEGHEAFAKFYREHRKDIYRDADGVEFPLFSDGEVIRQGVSVILAYLIAGEGLAPFIRRNHQHGEWIDGFDLSADGPLDAEAFLRVLEVLKQSGLKIELAADGSNAAVLEQAVDRGLVDRVVMEVRGPAALYGALTGRELADEELRRAIVATAKAPEHVFRTTVRPLPRPEGGVSYLTPEEIGETARLIDEAGAGKKNAYRLALQPPSAADGDPQGALEPLPDSAMFKYRTAARRHQVMTEIAHD